MKDVNIMILPSGRNVDKLKEMLKNEGLSCNILGSMEEIDKRMEPDKRNIFIVNSDGSDEDFILGTVRALMSPALCDYVLLDDADKDFSTALKTIMEKISKY